MLDKDDVVGDYKLEKFLGRGQFGEVWLAEKQLKFSTRKFRHALKFLSNSGAEIDLKAAEAEVDTWIEAGGHPNVMSVLDMLVFRNYVIIVSEFAEGGSLKNWFDKDGKAPSHLKALEMMIGILRGIEHLHSKNVVHRDLKPDNILLQGNFPRITDFGISRIVAEGTMSTKPLGSPAYMSPESFEGNKSPQNDIWSAGVILYEMLTGNYPFEAETIYGLITSIQQNEATPLPENIPQEIRVIVEKALQKNSTKRFQTAREMRLAVEKAIYRLKATTTEYSIKPKENVTEFVETVSVVTEEVTELQETVSIVETETKESESLETLPLPVIEEPIQVIEKPKRFLTTEQLEVDTEDPPNTKTQPEIENIFKTQPSKIEITQDAENPEQNIIQPQPAELNITSQSVELDRENRQSKQNRKMFFVAGGIGGSIIILAIFGFLISKLISFLPLTLIANSANSANTNSANPLLNPPTNNKPTVPTGMAYVSGGDFMMGRDDGKSEAEKPAHKVSVNPFFMDIYEVTNAQYAEFIKATNYKPPSEWKNGIYPDGQAKFPVVSVNWDNANAYAKWANKRLPTEEEWEFAARGTGNFLYPWGNDWKSGNANADGASKGLVEVGKFKGASPFGIYDMVGNAFEWTSSDFTACPNGKLPDVFTGKSNLKTIRGGSFEATKDFATSTYRIGWTATGAENYNRTGFRCLKDVE